MLPGRLDGFLPALDRRLLAATQKPDQQEGQQKQQGQQPPPGEATADPASGACRGSTSRFSRGLLPTGALWCWKPQKVITGRPCHQSRRGRRPGSWSPAPAGARRLALARFLGLHRPAELLDPVPYRRAIARLACVRSSGVAALQGTTGPGPGAYQSMVSPS